MGRGPGNVKTEKLLKEFCQKDQFLKNYRKLENSIINKFLFLKKSISGVQINFIDFLEKRNSPNLYTNLVK